ncbi:hypothetical protein PVAND_014720 [Polypedilum vanderplanki]|uniref:MULE transposase domain-containing protein n=1 Tax=Polypedilum vanderplanki TaxID=319348 RepID=A0A9J6B9Z9_POLVA|nr:hypothetical protein PVAND_014720 [Polypedilum vanderplanki]
MSSVLKQVVLVKAKAEYEIAFLDLRNTVRTDHRPIRVLHQRTLRKISLEASSMMPFKKIRKTLQRLRHEEMPVCQDMNEFISMLENNNDVFNTYGKLHNEDFYQGAINNMPIFANMILINEIKGEFMIFVDATFGITPFRQHQLLVILAELQGKPRPIIYAIMNSRSQSDYQALFDQIRYGVFSQGNVSRVPTVAMVDFEQAIRKALVNVWPLINVRGCYFHYSQAIRRKALNFTELSRKITRSSEHKTILNLFKQLSLLPINRVQVAYNTLLDYIQSKPLVAKDFESFIDYFNKTWFKRYSLEDWNVSDLFYRTNNHTEGHNNFLKQTIKQNPPPFTFLKSLLDLAYDASSDFLNDKSMNIQTSKDRSLISERLKKALESLNNGKNNEIKFLQLRQKINQNKKNQNR